MLGFAAGRLASGAQLTVLRVPGLRLADRLGGALIGGLLALALAWALAVLLLQQPSLGLRKAVQRSALLPALIDSVPPDSVLRTLERIDPLPILPQLDPGGPARAGSERSAQPGRTRGRAQRRARSRGRRAASASRAPAGSCAGASSRPTPTSSPASGTPGC